MRQYFEELYTQNKDLVYYTAYNVLKNKLDAEDVSVEVFYKLYKYLKENRNIKNIPGWLRITAKTTAIDMLRKNNMNNQILQIDTYQRDFANDAINKLFVNTMLNDLHRKNPKWLEYIAMRYLLEMSYSEIANATGRSEAAVKNAVSRAKKYIAQKNTLQSLTGLICSFILLISSFTLVGS